MTMKANKFLNDLSIESESEYYFDDQFNVPFDATLKNRSKDAKEYFLSQDIKSKDSDKLIQSLSESCIYSDMGSSYQEFPDVLDEILENTSINKRLFSPSQSISDVDPKGSMNKSSSSNVITDILSKYNRDYRLTFDEKNITLRKGFGPDKDNMGQSNQSTVTWNQLTQSKNVSLLKNSNKLSTKNSSSCSNINAKIQPETKIMSWNVLKNSESEAKRSRSLLKRESFDSKNLLDSRARSEPRGSLKLSSTLFEIFKMKGTYKDSTFEGNFTFNQKVNFGAQFPPVYNNLDYPTRNRSTSFDKTPSKYPGLGKISMPKGTRLNECTLLSKTLPDLSFLSNSDKLSECLNKRNTSQNNFKDSGFDSSGYNEKHRLINASSPNITNDLIILDDYNFANRMNNCNSLLSVPNFRNLDLLTGSPRCGSNNDIIENQSIDRSTSEPNFGILKEGKATTTESMSSNNSDSEIKLNKPKKSVSFSEKTLTKPLSPIRLFRSSIQLFEGNNFPKAIPRNVGLYGNESNMISEFTLETHLKSNNENELSNDDIKYKMLIKDIMKAAQSIVNSCASNSNQHNLKISTIIDPLYSLLTDGILPYQRNIVSIKSRYRLWNVIESSSSNESEIAAMRHASKIPISNEKGRFRAFIIYLINEHYIAVWFQSLVQNEALLKNNYAKESFLRQISGKMKGLYADLDTNLQLLDNTSFQPTNNPSKPKVLTNHSKSVATVKSLKKNSSNSNSNSSSVESNSSNISKASRISYNQPRSYIPERRTLKTPTKSRIP